MGWAKAQDDPDDEAKQTQRVACFSETPLEHIYSLFADISDRSIKLQPYGFAITKVVARMMGVNPVWYVDMTTRGGRIAPQAVAEGVSQQSAVHLKGALEARGARVKIKERTSMNGGGRREAIPAAVRREVWQRDEGRCVDCGSRERLEYDHIIAVANGGSNTARNLELRCEKCNRRKGASI